MQHLESNPTTLPHFDQDMGDGQLDLTQSSKDEALETQMYADTIVVTNCMTDHVHFPLQIKDHS